jgi:hypothetical protein
MPTKKSAAAAPAKEVDLFSFDSAPAAAAPAPVKSAKKPADGFDSFGSSDDFGGSNGFGEAAPADFGGPTNGFDAGFGGSDDFASDFQAPAPSSHISTAPQKAPLAVLIDQSKDVTVPQSAVKSLISQLRTMQTQFKLDASQVQAVIFQAFSHIIPPSVAAAMNISVPGSGATAGASSQPSTSNSALTGFGGPAPATAAPSKPSTIDLFADLQIEPTTRPSYMPGAEPDSGEFHFVTFDLLI